MLNGPVYELQNGKHCKLWPSLEVWGLKIFQLQKVSSLNSRLGALPLDSAEGRVLRSALQICASRSHVLPEIYSWRSITRAYTHTSLPATCVVAWPHERLYKHN